MKIIKKSNVGIIVLFCVMLLAGCGGLNLHLVGSNIADGYHKKIDSLSIIYLGSKFGVSESHIKQSDFNKLKIPFAAAGIRTDLFFYSGLDLNADENLNNYAKKNAYVLVIDPTVIGTGDSVNITYTLSLYDVSINKKIWIAELWVSSISDRSIFQRYDEMGNFIVTKLIDNGLVTQRTRQPATALKHL